MIRQMVKRIIQLLSLGATILDVYNAVMINTYYYVILQCAANDADDIDDDDDARGVDDDGDGNCEEHDEGNVHDDDDDDGGVVDDNDYEDVEDDDNCNDDYGFTEVKIDHGENNDDDDDDNNVEGCRLLKLCRRLVCCYKHGSVRERSWFHRNTIDDSES